MFCLGMRNILIYFSKSGNLPIDSDRYDEAYDMMEHANEYIVYLENAHHFKPVFRVELARLRRYFLNKVVVI